MYQKFIVPALIGFTVTFAANGVIAGPLENLERERAIAVETLLSTSINTQEKQDKINVSKRRLVATMRFPVAPPRRPRRPSSPIGPRRQTGQPHSTLRHQNIDILKSLACCSITSTPWRVLTHAVSGAVKTDGGACASFGGGCL